MEVAKWHGQQDVRVEDDDIPETGKNEVRIKVVAAGICGTDLHEYKAGPIFVPDFGEPNPITGAEPPVPLGHEFGGVVDEVGSDVTEFSPGDSVAVNPGIACGSCRYCDEGMYNQCKKLAFVGLSAKSGGFAEYATVPASNVHRLPDNVPTEYGALIEPLSVCLRAVRRAGIQAGDSVAVFGTGPIGLGLVLCATTAGAEQIFVSEPRDARRQLATDAGADTTIDPTETDAVAEITEATDGGVDVALEATGVQPGFEDAIQSARPGGQVTIVSISEDTFEIDTNSIVIPERNINGTLAYQTGPIKTEFERVINLLRKEKLDPSILVTDRINLKNIVSDGFERLTNPESNQVKILVEPEG